MLTHVTPAAPVRLLLGPQRPTLNLGTAVAGLPDGPIAVISAGWQEAEADIDDIRAVVERPLEDLRLYHRADELFAAETALADAYRRRQDRLKEQQRLYRMRLGRLAVAARETLRADGDADMIAAEQRHAIAQLRALDRHHLKRTETIHRQFKDRFNDANCPAIADHRAAIAEILERMSAVLITGGNVVVLLNRMRLFGVDDLLSQKHVVGWSAGAMVLAERIVLFHDRTPQGRRDAEVLGAGCGLAPGYLFLPDARRRLRERDRLRIGLMCRRFSPNLCVALDSGTTLRLAGREVTGAEAVRRLGHDGRFVKLRAA